MVLPTVGAVFFLFFFSFLSKILSSIFLCQTNGPVRMFASSQTYLFNSNYNIDPSTMVINQALQKYAFLLLTNIVLSKHTSM